MQRHSHNHHPHHQGGHYHHQEHRGEHYYPHQEHQGQHPHQGHQGEQYPHHQGHHYQHQGQHMPPGHMPPRPQQRPSDDPNHYDQLFHKQTRPERSVEHTHGNQRFQDYHLFAPKFQNHQDSSGHGDTWNTNGATPRLAVEDDRLPTKRGGRVAFPARTAPFTPTAATATTSSPHISHALKDRVISGYGRQPGEVNGQRVDRFNRIIDSMHLPDDMQRPVGTRDLMKSNGGDQDNPLQANNSFQGNNPQDQASRYIADRQIGDLNREGLLTIGGVGTFEDMFY